MVESQNSGRSDDETLTAYLDGELPADERSALETRLASRPALKARLDALVASNRSYRDAFDLVLDAAPRERLQAMLGLAVPRAEPDRSRRFWIAGAAVVLFAVGIAVGIVARPQQMPLAQATGAPTQPEATTAPNWRQVVAEYLGLTTPATLAILPDNPRLADAVMTYAGTLQLDVTADKLMLPMAMLKDVRLYDVQGKPMVEASYLTSDQMAVAFCIIFSGEPDAQMVFEQREGQNIVFWTKDGHGFMVAGTAPPARLQAFAKDLAPRFS